MTGSVSENKSPLLLISGASQGIGAAIAREFSGQKPAMRLALVARNADKLEQVAAQCSGSARVEIYPCDVSDAAAVQRLGQQLQRDMGAVDVLINNAGSWHGEPVADMAVEDFDRIIASNLRSVFLMCRQFLPAMLERESGDIFNMASTAGLEGYAGVSAYCAAKHGVLGFAKALREEVRGKNIRVCSVSPGPTWSPSWENSGIAEQALMPAEDVARAFWHLYAMDRNVVTEDIVLRPQQGHISS